MMVNMVLELSTHANFK